MLVGPLLPGVTTGLASECSPLLAVLPKSHMAFIPEFPGPGESVRERPVGFKEKSQCVHGGLFRKCKYFPLLTTVSSLVYIIHLF